MIQYSHDISQGFLLMSQGLELQHTPSASSKASLRNISFRSTCEDEPYLCLSQPLHSCQAFRTHSALLYGVLQSPSCNLWIFACHIWVEVRSEDGKKGYVWVARTSWDICSNPVLGSHHREWNVHSSDWTGQLVWSLPGWCWHWG